MKTLLILIFIIKLIPLTGQTVQGVDLAHYPAQIINVTKKAPIKWHTNPFKTKVKEIQAGYTSGAINFAGCYIAVLWEKGRDTVQGAMVDLRTGTVYPLPINAFNTFNKCHNVEDIFDRYLFLPTSKLFVTSTCKQIKEKYDVKVQQSFHYYLWNEGVKKFQAIRQMKKEKR